MKEVFFFFFCNVEFILWNIIYVYNKWLNDSLKKISGSPLPGRNTIKYCVEENALIHKQCDLKLLTKRAEERENFCIWKMGIPTALFQLILLISQEKKGISSHIQELGNLKNISPSRHCTVFLSNNMYSTIWDRICKGPVSHLKNASGEEKHVQSNVLFWSTSHWLSSCSH